MTSTSTGAPVADARAVARWRLHSQRLSGAPSPTAPDVVADLLGVQAENHAQASWAVAARTTGVDHRAFARLYDDGAILRTHVLRSTWHFVAPDDIRWLLELTEPRIRRTFTQQHDELGIDDALVERSSTIIVEALAGGVSMTRDELGERLAAEGIEASGRRLAHLVGHAELSALVCSGRQRDGRHTYALLDERAPGARRLDREAALAELALRYVAGHGPATERDLAYWATLTLTDVRRGLAAVTDQLQSFELDGRTYWYAPPPPDGVDRPEPRAHLLQILDELYRGYQDSRFVIDVDGLIVGTGREAATGMVVLDGQIVGSMRRTVAADRVRFDVAALRPLDAGARRLLEDAADRYGRFLDLPAELVVAGP